MEYFPSDLTLRTYRAIPKIAHPNNTHEQGSLLPIKNDNMVFVSDGNSSSLFVGGGLYLTTSVCLVHCECLAYHTFRQSEK